MAAIAHRNGLMTLNDRIAGGMNTNGIDPPPMRAMIRMIARPAPSTPPLVRNTAAIIIAIDVNVTAMTIATTNHRASRAEGAAHSIAIVA